MQSTYSPIHFLLRFVFDETLLITLLVPTDFPLLPSPCALCPVLAVLSRSLGANLLVYQLYALINLVPPSKSLIDCDTTSNTNTQPHAYTAQSRLLIRSLGDGAIIFSGFAGFLTKRARKE